MNKSRKIKVLLRKSFDEEGDPCTAIYAEGDRYCLSPFAVIYAEGDRPCLIGSIYNYDAERLGLPHVTRKRDGFVPATITITLTDKKA